MENYFNQSWWHFCKTWEQFPICTGRNWTLGKHFHQSTLLEGGATFPKILGRFTRIFFPTESEIVPMSDGNGTSWCFQSIKSSSNPLVNLLKIFWNVAPPSRKIDWWKCFQKVKGMIPWSYGRGFLPACIGNCFHILWECRQDLKSTNPKQTN